MSTAQIDELLGVDAPGDAELISAVRDGDTEAYGELFARHVAAARRLARQLVAAGDVDDLVSEAFAKVLVVLQRGEGPDLAFRAYLLTAVRRLHVDRIRATARLQPTDDLTPYDPGVPFHDTAVEGFDNAAAARAFTSLPERWQMVLWHTEVEEMKPADIAPLLGMSANSVSALAYRAREGLRQAFLSMHAQEAEHEACEWTQDNLGSYIRGGASRRDSGRLEGHLEDCRRCMGIYLELTEVNSNLRGILAPLVLGSAAAAYLKGASVTVGLGAWFSGGAAWLKDLVRQNAAATAATGVVAVATVAGVLAVTATGDKPGPASPAAVPSDSAPAPRPEADGGGRAAAAPPREAAGRAVAPAPPVDPPREMPDSTPATPPVAPPAAPAAPAPPAAPPVEQPTGAKPPAAPPAEKPPEAKPPAAPPAEKPPEAEPPAAPIDHPGRGNNSKAQDGPGQRPEHSNGGNSETDGSGKVPGKAYGKQRGQQRAGR